jgi:hypothetical protein
MGLYEKKKDRVSLGAFNFAEGFAIQIVALNIFQAESLTEFSPTASEAAPWVTGYNRRGALSRSPERASSAKLKGRTLIMNNG